jgi:glutaminase
MDYQSILERVYEETRAIASVGEVATYIPELATVNPEYFAIALRTVAGQSFSVGDSEVPFSTQSIAKVFGLSLALSCNPEEVWRRVGVEPSGDPFNSLGLLEVESGRPRNPLVNAGAIVVCDILLSNFESPLASLLELVRGVAESDDVAVNAAVASSELATAHRNRALGHLMCSFGNILNPVEEVIELYVQMCGIELSCTQLASAFGFLADQGRSLPRQFRLEPRTVRRINSLMLTCGFYDEAGEFAFSVGLPGKSGVGGGIAAACPQRYSIATWSPKLTKGGHSYLGTKALAQIASLTDGSIF